MIVSLLARLRGPNAQTRRTACREAAEASDPEPLLDALVERLGDRERAVARAAGGTLVALARRAPDVATRLRHVLRGDDRTARVHAALALARLEPPGPALLPALVDGLAAPEGDLRWAAARLLVDVGRLHGEVLPLLLALVRTSDDIGVRRMAAYGLRELAPDRPEAARVLLDATRDPAPALRRAAVAALAGLMRPPPEVWRRLDEALAGDPDLALRRLAATALGELGATQPNGLSPESLARLRRLRDEAPDPGLRRSAERALERLRPGTGL